MSSRPPWQGDYRRQLAGSQRILAKPRQGKARAGRGQREVASLSPRRGTLLGPVGGEWGRWGRRCLPWLSACQLPPALAPPSRQLQRWKTLLPSLALPLSFPSLCKPLRSPASPCPLRSPSRCHPPGVTLLAQSSTELGEPGRSVGALPMLNCLGQHSVGSRVVGLVYFGVQPAPLSLPLGWGLLR